MPNERIVCPLTEGEIVSVGDWWMRKERELPIGRLRLREKCKARDIGGVNTDPRVRDFRVECSKCWRVILGARKSGGE